IVAVLTANDAWVMNAWGKTLGFKDRIIGLSDPGAEWYVSCDTMWRHRSHDAGPNSSDTVKIFLKWGWAGVLVAGTYFLMI
ncbi:hypothetical protein FRC19_001632, partial [Serendipita sp. 401]